MFRCDECRRVGTAADVRGNIKELNNTVNFVCDKCATN